MQKRRLSDQTLTFLPHYLLSLLATLLMGCSTYAPERQKSDYPVAQQGLLDLRTVRFDQQLVPLNGAWKWYWKSLLSPGDRSPAFEYSTFPEPWSTQTWNGHPLPAYGYATYSLTILLPRQAPPLALKLPDFFTAYRLFVNDQELTRSGTPGTSPESTTPFWSTQIKFVPQTSDTLRLLLQVANFHHSKGGPYQPIFLGSAEELRVAIDREYALDYFLTGCLFMGGLFFLGLFLFGRHETSILYFSLFCLLYSYRIVGSDHYALHALFETARWSLLVHLEYLSLFVSVAVFVLYTGSLYPADVNRHVIRLLTGICLVFTVATLLLPPIYFTQLIDPFLGLMIIYIGYAFHVYWLAARRKRPGAKYSLMSTGVLLAVFIVIILKYFQIAIPENIVLFLGYIGFFFLQSLVLSYRFAFTLRQAKEQAEEGLRVKNEFLSTISHEIRTPLNAVIGLNHLLRQDNPRPDQLQHLDVMLYSANNLLHIVNDILDLNQIEAGKIALESVPMDPARILQNVVSSFQAVAREKSLALNLTIDPRFTPNVVGDPNRLAQVVSNLVQNAIKFTEQGGVVVSLTVDEQQTQTTTLTFAIEDTGIGIAPEKQQLIFNRFTQVDSSLSRTYGGTGMGLTISHKILQLQQVELRLQSQPGRGSRFYFTQTFPRVAAPAPEPLKVNKSVSGNKPLHGITILLVEDNAMNVLLAKNILSKLGATVDVANNGQEAVNMLDSTKHRLVLMDLQMPVMDGYEATRIIRKRNETLPIIAVTASLAQEIGERANDAGLDEVLVKPYSPGNLAQVILKHLKLAE
ncbi:ATP-binding protein [Larkinella insperata]|uniref:histidine kinase n=1 Tax=Larkinella insperata TaxID=332158 RepID=A0ABW3Q089_9BACT|nr:ATP-binding protein [Larkinella insperata]